MSEIQIYSNPFFGQIRTVSINDEPWFVGKNVAEVLGYQNGSRDINRHVDEEDRRGYRIGTTSGTQTATIINESGLYSLILSSKLPNAKEFKHWVTSEVLPSIRKNGGYIAGQNNMSDAELMAKAVLVAQKAIDDRDKRIMELSAQADEMRPKALFADSVAASDTSILIGELAKILRQNGLDIGQKRLFERLRNDGYLIKRDGSDRNMPTQRSMEMGLFRIKETVITHSDGHTTISKTTKVTGKGQQYFVNLFLSEI